MMMTKYVINGGFYSEKATGTQRFARELILELDKISEYNYFIIAIPNNSQNVPELRNIVINIVGQRHGILWEQIDFPLYVRKLGLTSINLTNTMPVFFPGIIVIHDAAYKTHPEFFTTLHGKLSVLWHRIIYRRAAMSRYPIVTVSYFSKYSLIDTYGINPKRIHVIYNGWQGLENVEEDKNVLEKNNLKPKEFFFTLGHVNYNKNTHWVIEYASKHLNDTFVFCGLMGKNSKIQFGNLPNVKYLGFLKDNEIAALYASCKAFIFPSIHEGFGIPPLEALSRGARIIVANTSSLPEIYKGCAHYIDAYNTDVDLDEILQEQVEEPSVLLSKYSYKNSANKLYEILQRLY